MASGAGRCHKLASFHEIETIDMSKHRQIHTRSAETRDGPMRIAKAMARAGLCSRREAERWIADGRVSVNGKLLKTPAVEVGPSDKVFVDGKPLPTAEPPQLWRYHKPKGIVTTHSDPEGPPDRLRQDAAGDAARHFRRPARLQYRRACCCSPTMARWRAIWSCPRTAGCAAIACAPRAAYAGDLAKLKDGVDDRRRQLRADRGDVDSVQGANTWLTIAIREGKNREVRNVLAHLGLAVNRLIRISFGPFQLLDLAPGAVEAVRRRILVAQLGPRAAEALGFSESQVTARRGTRAARRRMRARGRRR